MPGHPLAIDDLVQLLSLRIRPDLDPQGSATDMVTEGPLTGSDFATSGRVDYEVGRDAAYTELDLGGTAAGDTITGTYFANSCLKDTGICYCFRRGTYEVERQ